MFTLKIVLAAVVLVAISFIGLGLSIFFRKNGKFPENEVGHNKHMRELGIKCARCEEMAKYKRMKKNYKLKIKADKLKIVTE